MTNEEKLAIAKEKYGREFKCNRKVSRKDRKSTSWHEWIREREQKRVERLTTNE